MDITEKHFGRLGNRLFQSAFIYAQMREGNILDIYLQRPEYFDKYRDEINQIFGEGIVKDERIAIHVRRGDYVNNSFYTDLVKTDYYERAIEMFPSDSFVIFSDDIDWCKTNFNFYKSRLDFSEGKSVDEDLRLMAGCEGIIIANSSLSWWGAYLGNKNKKVIYPKAWFGDGVQRVGFPKEWIGI